MALGEDFAEAVWNASVMVSIILCSVLGTGCGGLSLAINIIHYVYICLYMENKYRACNDGENTLHRVQTVHLAANSAPAWTTQMKNWRPHGENELAWKIILDRSSLPLLCGLDN